jgi:hypothetical protein
MEKEKEDITNDEDIDTNINGDETPENEPSLETLNVQKRKALEQRDEARKKIAELEAKLAESSKENKSTPTVDKSADTGLRSELETIKFTIANKDIDADDVAEIVDYAKVKGISLQEAKKSPVITAYLKAKEEQKSLEGTSPDGSRSPKSKPEKTVSQMTREEHKEWAKRFGIK